MRHVLALDAPCLLLRYTFCAPLTVQYCHSQISLMIVVHAAEQQLQERLVITYKVSEAAPRWSAVLPRRSLASRLGRCSNTSCRACSAPNRAAQ